MPRVLQLFIIMARRDRRHPGMHVFDMSCGLWCIHTLVRAQSRGLGELGLCIPSASSLTSDHPCGHGDGQATQHHPLLASLHPSASAFATRRGGEGGRGEREDGAPGAVRGENVALSRLDRPAERASERATGGEREMPITSKLDDEELMRRRRPSGRSGERLHLLLLPLLPLLY